MLHNVRKEKHQNLYNTHVDETQYLVNCAYQFVQYTIWCKPHNFLNNGLREQQLTCKSIMRMPISLVLKLFQVFFIPFGRPVPSVEHKTAIKKMWLKNIVLLLLVVFFKAGRCSSKLFFQLRNCMVFKIVGYFTRLLDILQDCRIFYKLISRALQDIVCQLQINFARFTIKILRILKMDFAQFTEHWVYCAFSEFYIMHHKLLHDILTNRFIALRYIAQFTTSPYSHTFCFGRWMFITPSPLSLSTSLPRYLCQTF